MMTQKNKKKANKGRASKMKRMRKGISLGRMMKIVFTTTSPIKPSTSSKRVN